MYAQAIIVFGADENHRDEVSSFQEQIDAVAAEFPGFVESQVTAFDDPLRDWAVAVTFDSDSELRGWLASGRRADLIAQAEAAGMMTESTEIILHDKESPPSGVAVISHAVRPNQLKQFLQIQNEITRAAGKFQGYLGMALLPAGPQRHQWIALMRFDSERHLNRWMRSDERAHFFPMMQRVLEENFTTYTRTTPFGSVVRVTGNSTQTQVTPKWKAIMLLLTVLYPSVMLLSRYLNPITGDIGSWVSPGLQLFIGQVASGILLTYLLMPFMSMLFRSWMDPVKGRRPAINITGIVCLLLIYAAEISVFYAFPALDFWARR